MRCFISEFAIKHVIHAFVSSSKRRRAVDKLDRGEAGRGRAEAAEDSDKLAMRTFTSVCKF